MSATLKVKLNTRSDHKDITGWVGDRLKISVIAPPVDNRANEEMCAVLIDKLKLPSNTTIEIIIGKKESLKTLKVWNTTNAFLLARIKKYTGELPESMRNDEAEEDGEEAA